MSQLNRRHFLQHAAGLSALAVPSLSFLSALRAQEKTLKKQHKSLIILWMGGGPTTLDLWDPKPGHPNGGQFKPINTAVSGIQVTELLPNVAKQMKHLAVIRSLSTTEGDHNRGTTLMNTGRTPSPLVDFPALGSVLAYQNQESAGDIPSFVTIGGMRAGPGFLGMKFAPFTVNNPGRPPENTSPPQGIAEARMQRRAALFGRVERGFEVSTRTATGPARAHAEVYDKALSLVVSSRKDVFLLDKEPAALREEYGDNPFGRGCLLARKLVEAGSVCVQVTLGGWDNHQNIANALNNANGTGRANLLDKGMGALVRDLADRGLLKDTAIVWMGEFGRTPRINQNAGRDHYPRAWSVVVGGGRIKGGQVYGATDAGGEAVTDGKIGVGDLYATLYAALG
ncbi:MAG TPA: DUF1501 domain-containing protein, partial [Gemmataceae bacterium]